MKLDYKQIIPARYFDVSYETDVPNEIKEVLTAQIRKREGVYLWGDAGVGKTHLACAITKYVLSCGFEVMFFNTSNFLEKLREEYNKVPDPDDLDYKTLFREVMDFKGILIFDDIGAEKATQWTIERLYMIINEKYEQMIPVIFTSNCNLEGLSSLVGDRITSRLRQMTSRIKISGVDRRTIPATNNISNVPVSN